MNWTEEMKAVLDRKPIDIFANCDELWAYEEPRGIAIYSRTGMVALIDYRRCEAYLKRRMKAVSGPRRSDVNRSE